MGSGAAPGAPGAKQIVAPKTKAPQDIPGVPTAAWAKVKRGVPASDPFKPGEGFMLVVDGARFLPGKQRQQDMAAPACTVTRDGAVLCYACETGLSLQQMGMLSNGIWSSSRWTLFLARTAFRQ